MECVDVRSGSIIVDVRGSASAVDAVTQEIAANGLKLPSFSALKVSKMSAPVTTTSVPSVAKIHGTSVRPSGLSSIVIAVIVILVVLILISRYIHNLV